MEQKLFPLGAKKPTPKIVVGFSKPWPLRSAVEGPRSGPTQSSYSCEQTRILSPSALLQRDVCAFVILSRRGFCCCWVFFNFAPQRRGCCSRPDLKRETLWVCLGWRISKDAYRMGGALVSEV